MHHQYYGQKTLYDLTEDDEKYSDYDKDVLLAEVRALRERVEDLMVWNLGEKK